ncbi:DNA starvation/stationary phase protection protein [Rugosimonospora acidiphila]|uniref:DNA starvation/stationary phase protection protein n=1 Tax=Rugosimonospora acidiphila TaxID=556531 RepID=A0ABP9SJS5_9ACTN
MARSSTPASERNVIRPTKANGLVNVDVSAVGNDLQDTLVELTDLHLRAKQAHWNVVGRHFRQVHLHLDELTDEMRGAADLVAERAVSIGYPVDGRPSTVAKSTPLPEFPAGQVVDDEVVALITEALADVCGSVRKRVEHTDELDPATQDLLIEVLQTLEKQHWMFAAQKAGT